MATDQAPLIDDRDRLIRLLAAGDRGYAESFVLREAPELMPTLLDVLGPCDVPGQLELRDEAALAMAEASALAWEPF